MVALYVLLGFVLLLIIDAFVIKAEKKFHPAFRKNFHIEENVVFNNMSVTVPADSYLSKGHTWAELQGNGLVKVGVDEFVLRSLGQFIVTGIVKAGTLVRKGDPIIDAKLGEKTISFRSPIDGTISYINEELVGKSISDPYGMDWGAIISPVNFDKNVSSLRANEKVVEWMKNEFHRLKNYLIINSLQLESVGITMQDGGKIVEGAVSQLSRDSVKEFENQFLMI
jgi:glycine cleavage system H protein